MDQKQGSNEEFIFKELVFKILNSFTRIEEIPLEEPYSFSIEYRLPFFIYTLGELSQNDIFRDKVKKITDEITSLIITRIPLLHSHKVYLILGMLSLAKKFDLHLWKKHIHLLRQEIDVNVMFTQEFYDRNIFFKDGITGITFLLMAHNKSVANNEKIDFSLDSIKDKIRKSDTWNQLINDDSVFMSNSGLNGFCGISLLNSLNS
jgi:hypothetical protein